MPQKNKKSTKRILRAILLIGTLTSMFFVPWRLLKAFIQPLPDTLQEQVDEAIDLGFDGMILYVEQTGQAPQQLTAGWHNRDTKTPAQANALFKIASISKLYDAVAVTKLVSKKRLSLDKSLAEYLPELVGKIENADKITLKLLLQHRSGIPNFTDAPNFWAAPSESYEESIALIVGKPANFQADKKYEYCNTNYLLINKIMDNELRYDNAKFIQDEILDPLKLKHTFASLKDVNLEQVMSGYHVGYPYDLKENENGMLATAEDVGIFLRALNDGSIFEPGEKEIYSSIYEYEHSGWVPGYQSFAEYHNDIDAVIVAFYNTTDPKLYNWNLSEIINRRVVRIIRKQKNNHH